MHVYGKSRQFAFLRWNTSESDKEEWAGYGECPVGMFTGVIAK